MKRMLNLLTRVTLPFLMTLQAGCNLQDSRHDTIHIEFDLRDCRAEGVFRHPRESSVTWAFPDTLGLGKGSARFRTCVRDESGFLVCNSLEVVL